MIDSLKQLFASRIQPGFDDKHAHASEHALRLASAALLIEIASADFDFDLGERQALEVMLQREYGLSAKETAELVTIAEAQVDKSVALSEFTVLLDRNLDPGQKREMMELLWEIAFADGRIDKYEEYLLRKLADLLHISHEDFIRAKLRVEEARKRG